LELILEEAETTINSKHTKLENYIAFWKVIRTPETKAAEGEESSG